MDDAIKQRIADAKARREAAEAKREQLAASRAALEQAEREELEAANAEAIAAAEETHGPIGESTASVETHGGIVIVKRPNALLYKKIGREIGSKNDQKAEAAAERLIRECLVHPSPEAYDALAEEYAGLSGVVITLIVKLAAGGASVTGE